MGCAEAGGVGVRVEALARPPALRVAERLGRRITSRNEARKARNRAEVPFTNFVNPDYSVRLSVDRLDLATIEEIALIVEQELADQVTSLRGWAVVIVRNARGAGRRVEATRTDTNPYHADIVLGLPRGDDARDHAIAHAQDLARHASYQAPPP